MRLIDADKLKEHDFGDDYYVIKAEIDTELTVQAIPIEILDKIREEIEKQKECRCFDDDDMFVYMTGLNDAIDIIDKYREGEL